MFCLQLQFSSILFRDNNIMQKLEFHSNRPTVYKDAICENTL